MDANGLLFVWKQMMLKRGFILQIMNLTDYCLKEKIKKVIRLMKDNLDGKIMTKCFAWSAKTCTYLTDDDSKHKKTKGTIKCVMKEKLNLKIE